MNELETGRTGGIRSSRGDGRARSPDLAARLQLAAFGPAISGPFPRVLPARPPDPAPFGGRLRRRVVPALRGAGRAAAAGPVSARLPRRQPRALRARPEGLRRAGPGLRQHAFAEGRGRARHDSARGRRRAADLQAAAPGRRRAGAHRGALPSLPCAARGADRARAAAVRAGVADRLPFHAEQRRRRRRLGHRARRQVRRERRADRDRDAGGEPQGVRDTG